MIILIELLQSEGLLVSPTTPTAATTTTTSSAGKYPVIPGGPLDRNGISFSPNTGVTSSPVTNLNSSANSAGGGGLIPFKIPNVGEDRETRVRARTKSKRTYKGIDMKDIRVWQVGKKYRFKIGTRKINLSARLGERMLKDWNKKSRSSRSYIKLYKCKVFGTCSKQHVKEKSSKKGKQKIRKKNERKQRQKKNKNKKNNKKGKQKKKIIRKKKSRKSRGRKKFKKKGNKKFKKKGRAGGKRINSRNFSRDVSLRSLIQKKRLLDRQSRGRIHYYY